MNVYVEWLSGGCPFCCVNPKYSSCPLYKWAATVFLIRTAELWLPLDIRHAVEHPGSSGLAGPRGVAGVRYKCTSLVSFFSPPAHWLKSPRPGTVYSYFTYPDFTPSPPSVRGHPLYRQTGQTPVWCWVNVDSTLTNVDSTSTHHQSYTSRINWVESCNFVHYNIVYYLKNCKYCTYFWRKRNILNPNFGVCLHRVKPHAFWYLPTIHVCLCLCRLLFIVFIYLYVTWYCSVYLCVCVCVSVSLCVFVFLNDRWSWLYHSLSSCIQQHL